MAIYITTRGFFGGFALKPKKVKQFAPDGSPIYSTPIRFNIVSVGIDKASKRRQGILDTGNLPAETIEACMEWYGEDWKPKLEEALDLFGKRNGLERLKDGVEPPVLHPHKDVIVTSGTKTVSGMRGRSPHPGDADEK
jgi:hypothetical protein